MIDKQPVAYPEDSDVTDMFDQVLMHTDLVNIVLERIRSAQLLITKFSHRAVRLIQTSI